MNFVITTDENCVAPASVVIQSLKTNTLENKQIIIFGKGLSGDSVEKLSSMSSDSTTIHVLPIPDSMLARLMEIKPSNWSELIMLKLFFPYIWANAAGLFPDVQGEIFSSAPTFLYLGADVIAVRDVSRVFGFREKGTVVGASATFIGRGHLEYLENLQQDATDSLYRYGGVPSGDVLLFDMEKLTRDFADGNKFVSILEEQRDREGLFVDQKSQILIDMLRESPENIGVLKRLADDISFPPKCLSGQLSEDEMGGVPMAVFSEVKELIILYPHYLGTASNMSKAIEYWVEQSELKETEFERAIREHGEECIPLFQSKGSVTDEDVIYEYMVRFSRGDPTALPLSYNYVVSYRAPEVNVVRTGAGWDLNIFEKILGYPQVRQTLEDEWQKRVIVHFDGCIKPWSREGFEYAKRAYAGEEKCLPYLWYYQHLRNTPFAERQQSWPWPDESAM
ncbi:MAG: hypothetical protein LBI30_02225 [Holosporales bacterium]|jgi:lipopolysaccharide biosynthesis glycosyltransferase|nr:hypothetical protein [Holosporales bacterium]